MLAQIRKGSEATEFATEERCFITEVANDSADDQVSIARARVEPGVTTAWHKLIGTSERYLVICGKGLVEIADLEPAPVAAGDVVRIPPGCRQRITNTGRTDLVFYAICAPRFRRENYVALE